MKYICFALICFLSCINGMLFDTQSTKVKEETTFKIGGNIILTVPAEDYNVIEVERVSWAKKDNALFKTFKNNRIVFLNEQYKLRVFSYNESSITIRNATIDDAGTYRAQIRYRNTSTNNTHSKVKFYYVVKLPDNETEVVEPQVTLGYNHTRNDPTPKNETEKVEPQITPSDNTGAIAGIIVCLFILCIFIIIIIYIYKKKRKQKNENLHNHEPQNERRCQVQMNNPLLFEGQHLMEPSSTARLDNLKSCLRKANSGTHQ